MIEIIARLGQSSAETIIALVAIGILCTYVAYWLYSKGLKLVDTGKAAIVTMIEPLVSMTLAAFMFGEVFTISGYFFAALVILGVTLA